MASGLGQTPNPCCSCSYTNNGDAGNFECNICLELAQAPIVTLCGHLFCWPCLYKWIHMHSRSQECPVCKALIEEEKLVPLYGRGKNSTATGPRSKSVPGLDIPHRPTGQRPETARAPDPNAQQRYGFMRGFGEFAPAAQARIRDRRTLLDLLGFTQEAQDRIAAVLFLGSLFFFVEHFVMYEPFGLVSMLYVDLDGVFYLLSSSVSSL